MLARRWAIFVAMCLSMVLGSVPSLADNAYNQLEWAVVSIISEGPNNDKGEGNGFIINSKIGYSELLTVSHVLHGGEAVAPSDQFCDRDVKAYASGDGRVVISISSPLLKLTNVPATIIRDEYCHKDLAVVAIKRGPLPIACIYQTSEWSSRRKVRSQIETIGYFGNTLQPNVYPSTQGAIQPNSGKFLLNFIPNGISGSPVAETSYGLVVGVAAQNTYAYDNMRLENFLLGKTTATWISNPLNRSLEMCKPHF